MLAATANERPKVVLVNRCFVQDYENHLLIIRRSLTDRTHAGLWETPGGKLDKGQDLTHAQEREVLEETGFLVQPTHPLVYADSYVIGDGPYVGLPYVVLFSVTKMVGGRLKLSHEHTDAAWVSYDRMLKFDLTPEVRKAAIVLERQLDTLSYMPVNELELSVRAVNCLKGIDSVHDLTTKTAAQLREIQGLGEKTLHEIKCVLSYHGKALAPEE